MLKKMKERNQKAKELQQNLAYRVVSSINSEDLLDNERDNLKIQLPEGVKVPSTLLLLLD